MRNNDENLQMVKIGPHVWRNSDTNVNDPTKGTNSFTQERSMVFELALDQYGEEKDYMEVPVYIKYNRYDQTDQGVLYMLHIYRYRSDAWLVHLSGEYDYIDPETNQTGRLEAEITPEVAKDRIT